MRKAFFVALLLIVAVGPLQSGQQTIVSATVGGIFPDGTTFGGVPINGLEAVFGIEIQDGAALGEFVVALQGVGLGGIQQTITIEGKATAGAQTAANVATFSGTASVDMGTGAPPTLGVPFTATVVVNAEGQGTLGLDIGPTQAPAPPALPLGAAASFAVLGAATVTNTGPTIVTGDLGVSPGTAVTGFPPGTVVGGSTHAADALAAQAQIDATTAYNNLTAQACTTTFGPVTDLGGMTLLPGVYCFPSSAAVTGTLTLNAQGNPNAVFVFKTGSTFITASGASVVVTNGGQNCNVFWQVGSSATLGTTSTVPGTIIALASITLNTGASLSGRAIARTGAVTQDSNNVGNNAGGCAGGAAASTTLPNAVIDGGAMTISVPLTATP